MNLNPYNEVRKILRFQLQKMNLNYYLLLRHPCGSHGYQLVKINGKLASWTLKKGKDIRIEFLSQVFRKLWCIQVDDHPCGFIRNFGIFTCIKTLGLPTVPVSHSTDSCSEQVRATPPPLSPTHSSFSS